MTQAEITYNTIETNSYTNIFDEMNNRTNISDPRDPSNSGSRIFIYDRDPLHLGVNFNLNPYIILELPTWEFLRDSVNGIKKGIQFRHRIIVRTAMRGSSQVGRIDVGRTDMFSITDDLNMMFNSRTIREALKVFGITKLKLFKISTDTLSLDAKYMYESLYELTYQTPWLNVES